MKKGTAILLCTSMMLVAAGCADNASSSITSEAESVNSSQESSSDINSVISSENHLKQLQLIPPKNHR